jgi:acyl-CoA hydrolase
LSKNPAVIRQPGLININTALEADSYGNVNSMHGCGTQMMIGIGGSCEFERNGYHSVFVTPSVAKGGGNHLVHRGVLPAYRPQRTLGAWADDGARLGLYSGCGAHPGHTRHDLARCFQLNRNLLEHGSKLLGLRLGE